MIGGESSSMEFIPLLGLGNELVIRILLSMLIIAVAWLAVMLVQRGQAGRLKRGETREFFVGKSEIYGIYLGVIAIVAWLFEIPSLWTDLQSNNAILSKMVQVIVIWTVAVFGIRNLHEVFSQLVQKVREVPPEVDLLVRRIFTYSVYAIAILSTLSIFGLTGPVQGLLVGAGFAGIVIGFAAQDTLSNLFGGITLQLDRPFKVGDWIHLKGQNLVGFVETLSFRSVTIIGPDNTKINIPNSTLSKEPIVNYSSHKLRRLFLRVSISYESDATKATKVISRTLEKDPATSKEGIEGQGYFAPIEVVVDKFGDSSVDLQAKVFINTTMAGGLFVTKSRMLAEIKNALVKAGVEIPYPKRVVLMQNKDKGQPGLLDMSSQ